MMNSKSQVDDAIISSSNIDRTYYQSTQTKRTFRCEIFNLPKKQQSYSNNRFFQIYISIITIVFFTFKTIVTPCGIRHHTLQTCRTGLLKYLEKTTDPRVVPNSLAWSGSILKPRFRDTHDKSTLRHNSQINTLVPTPSAPARNMNYF